MADNLTLVSSVSIDRAPYQLKLAVDQVKFQGNNIIQIELTFMPRVRCYMQMRACITEPHIFSRVCRAFSGSLAVFKYKIDVNQDALLVMIANGGTFGV